MQKIIFSVLFILLILQAEGQKKAGTWTNYLSFANATKISVGNEKVYCVTEGGMFFYDLQDNSINNLSGLNGLSDFGIKTTAWNAEKNILIVAYTNSNIDLVYNSSVFNLSDIKRKSITGSKEINNISFIDGDAYLACGFGIVVVNLDKREIKDTYFIGNDGTAVVVNDVETDGEFLYAATDEGIMRAPKNGVNLLDYQNWQRIDDIPNNSGKFSHLAYHAGNLIANYTPEEYNQDKMYILNESGWSPYLAEINYAYDVQVNEGYMLVCGRGEVWIVDDGHSVIGKIYLYELDDRQVFPVKPRSAGISSDGSVWIADYEIGLVKAKGENFENICPNGPMDNYMFSFHQSGATLWIAPGGLTGWEVPRFQRYSEGEWDYFNKVTHPELDGFFNMVAIAVDPSDANHFFAASWGGGLLEYRNDEFVKRYTHNNSLLQTIIPPDNDEHYIRIGGMDFDSEGNLWMTNSQVAETLVKLSSGGDWESFALPEIANDLGIGKVIVTQNDDKWILVPRGHDAYVVDKTGTQKKRLYVTSYFNNGENEIFNRMNDVYSIAEDNDGAVWIGTSKGVAVYNNAYRIWNTENFYATQPSLDLNDGLYHPLLENETITAIAVDGANRKWLGTQNSGVYLISETGEEEILHYTTENSALLSNNITAISINQLTGEVFIGTDDGLISYQGDATGGRSSYENVYVYPNPVRETYDGPVTVAGLIENTDVKITDISGNLVYKTVSLGGQAVWDGKNLNGNRVKTGVYLVFCNDEAGVETHIAKLLFIH